MKRKEIKNILEWIFLLAALIFMICLVFFGCKSKTVYIPVESVKTEYINKVQRDSIHLLDSVFVDRWKNNDTVFLTTEKYKYLYRDKFVTDTVMKIDSIQVPYEIQLPAETKTIYPKWLVILACLGTGTIGYTCFRLLK